MKRGDYATRFCRGIVPMTMRPSFKAGHYQYVGLYAGNRLLGTADVIEADARIICELFNEGVRRRQIKAAAGKVKHKRGADASIS